MSSPKIIRIYDADAAPASNRIDDLRTRIEKRDRTLPAMVAKGPAGRAWTTKDVPEPMQPFRPLLAYVLGPLAGMATPAGRVSRTWTFLAVASTVGWVLALRFGPRLWERAGEGDLVGAAGVAAIWIALWVGVLAWTRGLVLATPRGSAIPQKGWITKPWLVGGLGTIAPGLGLALVGRSRRAAIALLNAGFLATCVFFLLHAAPLWQASAHMPEARPALEWIFLAAGLGIFLGAVLWVVLVLEGLRLVPGPKRVATRWGRWGDAFAVALLGSVIAFAVLFRPAPLARHLDESGVSLTAAGYRVIPGLCFQGAMRLDPSKAVYVLHAAELAEATGDETTAATLREDLDQRIEPVLAKDTPGIVTKPGAEATPETAGPGVPWVEPPPLPAPMPGPETATGMPEPWRVVPPPRAAEGGAAASGAPTTNR